MKEALAFIYGCVYVFNLIGSTGYLFYIHEPQFAIASLCVCAMAIPFIKEKVFDVLK